MARSPRVFALLFFALAVAACERPAERRAERDYAAKILSGLLAYPRSSVVDVSTGQGAAQVTLSAPAVPESVATWYRQVLRLNGWDLVNDSKLPDGTLTIYAQRGTRPIWVTLRTGEGGGTSYTLIGADTTADSTGAQRSGSSMSSNRIQRR